MVPPIHLAHCTMGRVFKGLEEQVCGSTDGGGEFSLEDSRSWPFKVKGHQHQIFWTAGPWLLKGFWCSHSVMFWSFSSVCVLAYGGGEETWFWVQL